MIKYPRNLKFALVSAALLLSAAGHAAEGLAQWDSRMVPAEKSTVAEGLRWYDGKDIPLEGRAFSDTESYYDRLPAGVTTNISAGVRSMKHWTAGMQFRFRTSSRKIVIRWEQLQDFIMDHMPLTGSAGIDVYARGRSGEWRYRATGRVSGNRKEVHTLSLDWSPNEDCLINLPLYNGLSSFSLGIETNATLSALPPRASGVQKPVVFYGTSITHGACASRPGMSFVNIVGRDLDVPVVNLGFSGNGKMEFEMSEWLAKIDASCYVLDCLWNMNEKEVESRFEPFVRNLRAKRPNVPIVFAEQCDVFCRGPNAKDRYMKKLCQELRSEGWKKLVYLPKTNMYSSDGDGTVDGCHPTDLGMRTMADAFGKAVKYALGL